MGCSVNIVALNLAMMAIASCVIAVPANYGAPRGSLVSVMVDGVEYSPLEYHRKHHLFRNMYPDETMWPIGADGMVVVPYQLGVGVNKAMMERAMRKWEKDTCIRFREMAATEVKEGGYLQIKNAKECTANVGINPDYPSVLKIEDACTDKGFIHELAHVMGFAHETSRSDRDKYVHVHRENVDSAALYDLYYGIIATNNFDVPFDYNSIMIASEGGTEGKLVVVSLNPLYQTAMGSDLRPSDVTPSFMNTKTMNRIYKCVDTNLKTCKLDKDPCLNHGYMGPACKCLCPPGTKGKNCEVLKMSYEDAMLKLFWPNSTKITKPNTVVQTPGYPDAVNSELVMDIVLQAGKCERVVLTFEGFSVMERSAQGLCQSDKLAIKSKVDDASPRTFCGKDILPGQVFKSDQSLLILSYHGFNYAGVWGNNGGTTGWKALFTTERIAGCTG